MKNHRKIDGFRGPNQGKSWEKLFQKHCFFRLLFFIDFGRVLGGVLEVFWDSFLQLVCAFSHLREHFLDFLQFWQQKLLKFTRCGGLEALKGYFGVHLRGTWLEKRWNLMVFLNEKVDWRRKWHAKFNQGANGARTGKKFSSTLRISLKIKSLFKCWACLRQLQCTVFAVVLFLRTLIWQEKVDWRRDWHAKFNQGSNGARTGKKFSPRFPFSRCSGSWGQILPKGSSILTNKT